MIATTHLAVGAAVGLWGSRLAVLTIEPESDPVEAAVQIGTAFILATCSHLVLDAMPHNDEIYRTAYGTAPILAIELAIIFSIIFFVIQLRNLSALIIFSGLVGAAWLDVFSMFGWTTSIHEYFHSLHRLSMFWSLITQVLIAIVSLVFLF